MSCLFDGVEIVDSNVVVAISGDRVLSIQCIHTYDSENCVRITK